MLAATDLGDLAVGPLAFEGVIDDANSYTSEFTFNAPAGAIVSIAASTDQANRDLNMTLYDASTPDVAFEPVTAFNDNASADTLDPAIDVVTTHAATYRVRIDSYTPSSTSYKIAITSQPSVVTLAASGAEDGAVTIILQEAQVLKLFRTDDQLLASPSPIIVSDEHGDVITADSFASEPAGPIVNQYLPPGRYDLRLAPEATTAQSIRISLEQAIPPSPIIDVPYSPKSFAVGDLDNNGLDDLVTFNDSNEEITVFLRNVDGTSRMLPHRIDGPVSFAGQGALACADFNGDHILDLVRTTEPYRSGNSPVPSTLCVSLGVGDGTFRQPHEIRSLAHSADELAIGDIDGDQQPDVVTWDSVSGIVSTFSVSTEGSVGEEHPLQLSAGLRGISIGNVNGDPFADIALCDSKNRAIAVVLGTADRTLTPGQSIPTAGTPVSVQLTDVNGNGDHFDDIASLTSGTLTLLLNDRAGSFEERQVLDAGHRSQAMTTGDFNHDGRPDIATVSDADGIASIFLNELGRGFGERLVASVSSGAKGVLPTRIVAGLFNTDLFSDIATVNTGDGTVSVLASHGDGTFDDDRSLFHGSGNNDLVLADLNADGRLDAVGVLYTSNQLSIQIGIGDGTFSLLPPIDLPGSPFACCASDINGDGRIDIAVVIIRPEPPTDQAVVLYGLGDGTFIVGATFDTGAVPVAIVAADTDGDRRPEVFIASYSGNVVKGFKRRDDGTFHEVGPAIPSDHPRALATGDMTGDGIDDVVIANEKSKTITVIARNNRGQLGVVEEARLAFRPRSIALADLDGDRSLDLVVAVIGDTDDADGAVVAVFRELDGTLSAPCTLAQSQRPVRVVTEDFNRDSLADIAFVDNSTNTLGLLIGDGHRKFVPTQRFPVGRNPTCLAAGDLDGDRNPEVAVAGFNSNSLSVAQPIPNGPLTVGRDIRSPDDFSLVVSDANDDGIDDIIRVNYERGTVTLLLGGPGGLFTELPARAIDNASVNPKLINGFFDDRFDRRWYAVQSDKDYSVSLFTMDRFGQISARRPLSLPASYLDVSLRAHLVSDLDADGLVDVVFRDNDNGTVVILEMNGNGDFEERQEISVDPGPTDVVTGDFDHDGILDLAVQCSDTVCLIKGLADGTYDPESVLLIPIDDGGPLDLALADVTGDGSAELLVGTQGNRLELYQIAGKGGFEKIGDYTTGEEPGSITVGDVNGDSVIDIVVASWADSTVTVFSGGGGGQFSLLQALNTGDTPDICLGDFNGDGRIDVVAGCFSAISLLLSASDHLLHERRVTVPISDVEFASLGGTLDPALAPSQALAIGSFICPGSEAFATLDRSGLLRTVNGLSSQGSSESASERTVAWDACAVKQPSGVDRLATIDLQRSSVLLHEVRSDGTTHVVQTFGFPAVTAGSKGSISRARIASFDLNGDGYGDLIASDPGAGTVDFLLSDPDGRFSFQGWRSIPAAAGVSRILLEDINGDGVVDLISAGAMSGDVSIRYGVQGMIGVPGFQPGVGFGSECRYFTSKGVRDYGVDPLTGHGTPVAPFKLTDIALGDVTGDTLVDIVAVNAQAHSFAILEGLRGGGFSAPQEHLVRIPLTPGPVVARTSIEVQVATVGDFDGDGRADIAFLDRQGEQIVLYTTSDNPTFEQPGRLIPLKGNLPRSLLASDVGGPSGAPDGVLDLVIGNDYGDVLILQGQAGKAGRGNGLFETLVRTDKSVALLAADMDGDGKDDFVYGNKGLDRVTMDTTGTKEAFRADQASGIIGPSAVATVDETVAGRAMRNLVVANGGANEILLFSRNPAAAPGSPDLFLAPQRFFVGSNPSSLAVADVDADGIPDVVVANAGSNDLSVMLGSIGADGRWTMKAGPRLAAGGSNPAGVALGDFVRADGSRGRDGTLDIAVTTPGSNSANILAGRGGGFFNDRLPLPLILPPDASPGPIVTLPGGIGIGNIGNATITIVDVTRSGATQEFFASRSYSSGGVGPSSLSTFSSGGTTYLGVGNASGSVSLFVGKAGSLDFTLDRAAQLPGVTGVAFESTGRLFGMGPGRQSALDLFGSSVAPVAAGTGGSGLAAISAAVLYLPLRSSAVALVATIISSGALGSGEGSPKTAPVATGRTGDRPAADGASGGEEEGDDEGKPPKDDTEAEAAEDPAIAAILKLFLDVETALRTNNRQLLDTLLDGEDGDRTPNAGSEAPAAPAPAESEPPTALLKQLTDWWNLAFTGGGEGDDGDRSGAAAVEGDAPQPRLTVPSGPIPTASIPSAAWLWGGLFSVGETDQLSPAANRRRPLERDRPKRGGHRAPQLTSHRSPRRGK